MQDAKTIASEEEIMKTRGLRGLMIVEEDIYKSKGIKYQHIS